MEIVVRHVVELSPATVALIERLLAAAWSGLQAPSSAETVPVHAAPKPAGKAEISPPVAQIAEPTPKPGRQPSSARAKSETAEPLSSWSAERRALGKKLRSVATPWDEMRARLNALPGRPISSTHAVKVACARFHWLAPPAVILSGARAAPPPALAVHAVPPEFASRDGHFSVSAAQLAEAAAIEASAPIDLDAAISWGRQNGITRADGESDAALVARINKHRAEYELPLYTIVPPRGPAEALPDPRIGGHA